MVAYIESDTRNIKIFNSFECAILETRFVWDQMNEIMRTLSEHETCTCHMHVSGHRENYEFIIKIIMREILLLSFESIRFTTCEAQILSFIFL